MNAPLERLASELHEHTLSEQDVALRRALKQVVCFPLYSSAAFPGIEISSQMDPVTGSHWPTLSSSLDARLAEQFSSRIFVERPEVARVVDRLHEGRSLVVLTGDKGAGKTTVVREVHRRLSGRTTQRPSIVVDVRGINHILEINRPTGRLDLCSALYEALSDLLFLDNEERRASFLTYLLQTDPIFFPLRSRFGPNTQFRPGDRLLADNQDLVDTTLRRFEEDNGTHKLQAILEFLRSEDGLKRTLFLDNVDQYSSDFQVNVATKLDYLLQREVIEAALIAIRPENYDRVRHSLDGLNFVTHVQLDPLYGNDQVSGRLDSSRDGDRFFVEYLERRLGFLRENLDLVAGTLDRSSQLDSLVSTIDNLRRFARTVDVFGQLTRWYNGSARATAYSFLGLLRRVLLEHDIIWQDELGDTVIDERIAREQRLVRSLVYRQMILDDDENVFPPSAPMVYDSSYPSCANEGEVPFLELHLLTQLSRHTATTVDEIREHAHTVLGVPADRTDQALRILWSGRGIDETGLVHVDQSRRLPLNGVSEVRLLRSGRFMEQTLTSSCEYLFWSAIAHQRGSEMVPRHRRVSDLIRSEELRVTVAITFFQDWIVPTLDAFVRSLGEVELRRYHEYYPRPHFASRIEASLRTFIQTSKRLPSDSQQQLASRLTPERS